MIRVRIALWARESRWVSEVRVRKRSWESEEGLKRVYVVNVGNIPLCQITLLCSMAASIGGKVMCDHRKVVSSQLGK